MQKDRAITGRRQSNSPIQRTPRVPDGQIPIPHVRARRVLPLLQEVELDRGGLAGGEVGDGAEDGVVGRGVGAEGGEVGLWEAVRGGDVELVAERRARVSRGYSSGRVCAGISECRRCSCNEAMEYDGDANRPADPRTPKARGPTYILVVECGISATSKLWMWKYPSACFAAGGPTTTVGDGRAVEVVAVEVLETEGEEPS